MTFGKHGSQVAPHGIPAQMKTLQSECICESRDSLQLNVQPVRRLLESRCVPETWQIRRNHAAVSAQVARNHRPVVFVGPETVEQQQGFTMTAFQIGHIMTVHAHLM